MGKAPDKCVFSRCALEYATLLFQWMKPLVVAALKALGNARAIEYSNLLPALWPQAFTRALLSSVQEPSKTVQFVGIFVSALAAFLSRSFLCNGRAARGYSCMFNLLSGSQFFCFVAAGRLRAQEECCLMCACFIHSQFAHSAALAQR